VIPFHCLEYSFSALLPRSQHAASYGECLQFLLAVLLRTALTKWQLTKDEEASAQNEDLEVRREDQEKINRFSSLHQKEELIEEELRAKIVRLHVRWLPSFPSNHCAEGEGGPRRDLRRARVG
jgi:hypothetical protein